MLAAAAPLHISEGDAGAAAASLTKALEVAEQLGDTALAAHCRAGLGDRAGDVRGGGGG